MNHRIEHDSLGELEVPAEAYYGCQTLRAKGLYNITGGAIAEQAGLIRALAWIKTAAAQANRDLGLLPPEKAEAVVAACGEVLEGRWRDQFIVDPIQGGAGTSTNMNANEVVCNRALELMGHERGQYEFLHPLNDVNMSQSTNDVYPTALRIAVIMEMKSLMEAMRRLCQTLEAKGEEFAHVLKMGRTQLQDAVPMTLGREFTAWAVMLREDAALLDEAAKLIREINMGATAIGTGINADPGYSALVTEYLNRLTGLDLLCSPDLVEATQDTGAYVHISGVFKRTSVKLIKICNDLRLLSSGPRCGLNEINLPALTPGSSIMPGKVNPIIPEVVNQIAFLVIGNDATISLAAQAGQLQLNVMEPVIAYCLFQSIMVMRRGCRTLADLCIKGITANEEHCLKMVKDSAGLATALNPYIGYEVAAEVAKKALATGRTVYEVVLEEQLLSADELERILTPDNMLCPARKSGR